MSGWAALKAAHGRNGVIVIASLAEALCLWNEQANGFRHHAERRLPADQQQQHFPEQITNQEHQREHHRGQQQRNDNLPGQI